MRFRAVLCSGVVIASVMFASSCSSTQQSSSCPRRVIAGFGARTGPSRRPPFQNGAELAVHLYNEKHLDCPVGYISFDSQGNPDIAKRLAQTIIDDPAVLAVVGPGYSGESKAALPIFQAAGLANITASATNPILAEQGWTIFHRIVGNDAAQGPAAAAFLSEVLKVRRVAIIDDGGLYGKTIADLVAKGLGDRGVVIAPRGEVNPDGLDYRATVSAIAKSGVDAVFYGGVTEPGVRLLRQLRDADVNVAFMGGDGIFDGSFISGVGLGSEGAYATCPCIDPDLVDIEVRKNFNRAYQAFFHESPVGFAMEYYDAANIILNALDNGVITRSKMDAYIDAVSFDGIAKRVSFDATGEVRVGPIYVMQAGSGRFRQVASVIDGHVEMG